MLLERKDIAADVADKHGRTPLSWAAGNGNDYVVKMLLARDDVNPYTKDKSGGTPLVWAAGNGQEEAVKMLVRRVSLPILGIKIA